MSQDNKLTFSKVEGAILVVEENRTNRLIMAKFLEKLGCSNALVSSGEEALSELKNNNFDLIMMDCSMPGMDGFQTTKEIRTSDDHSKIPIIALVTEASIEEEKKCFEAGMNDMLKKPLSIKALHSKLDKFLNDNESQIEVVEQVEVSSADVDQSALDNLVMAIGEDGLKELIKAYLETLDDSVDTIVKHLETTDNDNASRAAHSLKSSTLSLGGLKLGEACKAIELAKDDSSMIHDGTITELKSLTEEFKVFLNSLL